MPENKITTPKTPIWKSQWGRVVFVAAILLAIFSILLITNWFHLKPSKVVNNWDLIVYFAWTILPPAWFLFEYVWLFSDADKLDPNKLADLKYTHELAGKIWAGLVTLLSVILYLKYYATFGKFT